jgi:EmrB/QacA subfamily drug resistance transporter
LIARFGAATLNRMTESTTDTDRKPWTTLILLGLAQFMVILDITVVNVALPSIADDLDFAAGDLQWVITSYVLFTGGLLMLGGRANDLFGRRRVFLAGLATFTVASLVSGLASSPEMLVAARAVQGIGAAMLTPGALSIVTTTYSGDQRTAALAAWSAIGSAGAAAGVVLGGVLTSGLGWEWVFFINVPVGVVAGIGVLRVVPSAPPAAAGQRLDVIGAVTAVLGLVVLLYAIEGANDHGWTSARTLGLVLVAAVLLATFAWVERTVRDPLIPPVTWRNRPLIAGSSVILVATGLLVAVFFLNTLYLQDVLAWSALETGLAFLPLVVVIAAGAKAAAGLVPRLGAPTVSALGLVLIAGGAVLLALAPDVATFATEVLPGFLVLGFGVGLVFPAGSIAAMSDVAPEEAGLASGLVTTGHELGAAFGVAAISAVATAAPTFVAGYSDGFVAVAAIAVLVAAIAFVGSRSAGSQAEAEAGA